MRGLEGRCALVTGAAGGIGRAIAERLTEEGARVAVSDLSRHDAEATAADLGEPAIGVELDVTSDDSIRRAVEEVHERLGPIDVLVNNAGWDQMEPFLDSKPETWDRVLAINLRGPIAVTRAVLESMVERGAGRIVSIASDAGRVGSSGEAVYSGAKAGIMGFSRTVAREVAARASTSTRCAPARRTRRCCEGWRRRTPSWSPRFAAPSRSAGRPSPPRSPPRWRSWRPTMPPSSPARRSRCPVD